MTSLSNLVRSKGDPKIIRSGPSSLPASDRMARNLGWFSIALGVTELVAAPIITRALGMPGREGLVRSFGLREIASGFLSLSVDKKAGLWSRVAGDLLDLAVLREGLRGFNPRRSNVSTAMIMVAGITVIDILTAKAAGAVHARSDLKPADYGRRTGFPSGVTAARGRAAESFSTPRDMRAELPR